VKNMMILLRGLCLSLCLVFVFAADGFPQFDYSTEITRDESVQKLMKQDELLRSTKASMQEIEQAQHDHIFSIQPSTQRHLFEGLFYLLAAIGGGLVAKKYRMPFAIGSVVGLIAMFLCIWFITSSSPEKIAMTSFDIGEVQHAVKQLKELDKHSALERAAERAKEMSNTTTIQDNERQQWAKIAAFCSKACASSLREKEMSPDLTKVISP